MAPSGTEGIGTSCSGGSGLLPQAWNRGKDVVASGLKTIMLQLQGGHGIMKRPTEVADAVSLLHPPQNPTAFPDSLKNRGVHWV